MDRHPSLISSFSFSNLGDIQDADPSCVSRHFYESQRMYILVAYNDCYQTGTRKILNPKMMFWMYQKQDCCWLSEDWGWSWELRQLNCWRDLWLKHRLMLASRLGHSESYSKTVRYSHETSDKLQAIEGEKYEEEFWTSHQVQEHHMTTEARVMAR